jgi:threonine synthase
MTTKLTLTIEQEVIKTAKTYAQKKGRSLSDLIENYLKTLVHTEKDSEELSPRVKRLVGSVKLPENFDYKKTLEEEIIKKHG